MYFNSILFFASYARRCCWRVHLAKKKVKLFFFFAFLFCAQHGYTHLSNVAHPIFLLYTAHLCKSGCDTETESFKLLLFLFFFLQTLFVSYHFHEEEKKRNVYFFNFAELHNFVLLHHKTLLK